MDKKTVNQSWCSAEQIEKEYNAGIAYKTSMHDGRGMYEQNRINERFYVGDQWHGAQCGNERPLVRHNIIKRIGDYKMAVVGASSLAVSYSAAGVPLTVKEKEKIEDTHVQLSGGETVNALQLSNNEKINLIMDGLSNYFRVTAERVKFDDLKTEVLKNAYVRGTGVLYTYWDKSVHTGMYVDAARQEEIKGDIACEMLNIENVYFGDTAEQNVQKQPYIIIAQRKRVDDIRRMARANGIKEEYIAGIAADDVREYDAYTLEHPQEKDDKKAVLLTKFYKQWDDNDNYRIMAVQVCNKVTVREAWDTTLRLYPIAKMNWENRDQCAYGESEVTHIVPNQIAINRAITASVWSVMQNGMPTLLVNGDIVSGVVGNEPGQVIRVYGDASDMTAAMRYVTPPDVDANFDGLVNSLIENTLRHSGATEAAIGDVAPDNTSAIVAVQEAAALPMQILKNRFYSFVEDVARIWAEFFVQMYGKRSLKINDKNGEWYLPFDGAEYQNILITAKIDVGASGIWSEAQSIRTLDNLYAAKIINDIQYLERIPQGIVKDLGGIIRDKQAAAQQPPVNPVTVPTSAPVPAGAIPNGDMAADVGQQPPAQMPSIDELLAQMPPEYAEKYHALSDEEKAQVLQMMQQNMEGSL